MAWNQVGFSLMGPKGDQGDPGEQGPKGDDGAAGPAGADGKSVSIVDNVATVDDLPTGLGTVDAGKGWIVDADGHLHVWSGTEFTDVGQIQGPAGPTGGTGPKGDPGSPNTLDVTSVNTGAAGSQAQVTITGTSPNQHLQFTIPQGAKGDTGERGTDGTDGADGARGTKWFYGTSGPSGTVTGAQVGDLYLASDGTVYVLS